MKAMVREALVAPERIGQVASRHTDANRGRQLSDRAASHLEVLTWVCTPILTYRQLRVIQLRFRDGLAVAETGRLLGWSEETVRRDQRDAIQTLTRIIWNDPTYVTSVWSDVKLRVGSGASAGPRGSQVGLR